MERREGKAGVVGGEREAIKILSLSLSHTHTLSISLPSQRALTLMHVNTILLNTTLKPHAPFSAARPPRRHRRLAFVLAAPADFSFFDPHAPQARTQARSDSLLSARVCGGVCGFIR